MLLRDVACFTLIECEKRSSEKKYFPSAKKRYVIYMIELSTNSILLAGKTSVPAVGPFMVLLPAGGPFNIFAAVRACWWALRIVVNVVTADVSLQVPSQLSFCATADVWNRGAGQGASCIFFSSMRQTYQPSPFQNSHGHQVTTRNSSNSLCLAQTSAAVCRESRVQRAENHYYNGTTAPRVAPPEGPCAELCPPWSVSMPLWVC